MNNINNMFFYMFKIHSIFWFHESEVRFGEILCVPEKTIPSESGLQSDRRTWEKGPTMTHAKADIAECLTGK